jgi:hypothetical protein
MAKKVPDKALDQWRSVYKSVKSRDAALVNRCLAMIADKKAQPLEVLRVCVHANFFTAARGYLWRAYLKTDEDVAMQASEQVLELRAIVKGIGA